jgi:hypothetical protein
MGCPIFSDKIKPGQMLVIWEREWADIIHRLQATWPPKNMERESGQISL